MLIDELERKWNEQADKYNQWMHLGLDEKLEFAVAEERKRIADALRRAGASLPAPENKGTVESAMATGLSIALMIVCDEEKEK